MRDWFKRYRAAELPERFEHVVQGWDTANKPAPARPGAGEFRISASARVGGFGRDSYLLGVLHRRMEYPELKRAVLAEYARLKPDVVLIEDRASGMQR